MTQYTNRRRIVPLTVCTFVFALALTMSTAATAAAHAASPTARSQQVTVKINGKNYYTSAGVPVRLPTTYPDGSKGWIDYTPGTAVIARQPATSFSPKVVNCHTAGATQSWYDSIGVLLIRYTLSQYWCYDGTYLKSWTGPGSSFVANLGWSLVNQAAVITTSPHADESVYAISRGTFRFNGPWGIGCKSGQNSIFWWGTGAWTTQYDSASYYGC